MRKRTPLIVALAMIVTALAATSALAGSPRSGPKIAPATTTTAPAPTTVPTTTSPTATVPNKKTKPPANPGTPSTGSNEPAPSVDGAGPVIPQYTQMELTLPNPVSDGKWAAFKLVITPGVGVQMSNVNVGFVYTNNLGATLKIGQTLGWATLRNVMVNGKKPLYNDGSSKHYYLVASLVAGHPVTIAVEVQAPERQLVDGTLNRWFYLRARAYTTSPVTNSLDWELWSNNAYQIYAGT